MCEKYSCEIVGDNNNNIKHNVEKSIIGLSGSKRNIKKYLNDTFLMNTNNRVYEWYILTIGFMNAFSGFETDFQWDKCKH